MEHENNDLNDQNNNNEYVFDDLYEMNNNYANIVYEGIDFINNLITPAVNEQPTGSSIQDIESTETIETEDYTTDEEEDLMALYLDDMYVPPKKKFKKDEESTSDSVKTELTSQEKATNSSQSSKNQEDEAEMNITDRSSA